MSSSATTHAAGRPSLLPILLDRYVDVALVGLLVGTLLCLLALFTNPVPDPSFPWATLPANYRLPVTQPRIEHWPVTYTVGIWLWIVGFSALFLAGFRRYSGQADSREGGQSNSERLTSTLRASATLWLVGLPTASMLAWTTYCRFFWPKLHPPTWNAPSYTLVCWLYCSSYDPLWSNLAYAIAVIGVVATVFLARDSEWATAGLTAFGVLSLPLGLPALYAAYRRTRA